jgi:hypothetical protein
MQCRLHAAADMTDNMADIYSNQTSEHIVDNIKDEHTYINNQRKLPERARDSVYDGGEPAVSSPPAL